MSSDIYENFHWHSAIGIDAELDGRKKFVTRVPNTKKARSMFVASGNDLLIHKATKALWQVSEDEKTIEPVFPTDILSEKDLLEEEK